MSHPDGYLGVENSRNHQNGLPLDNSLLRRSSTTACGDPSRIGEAYDLPFHIGSVAIIFFVSASACAFPIAANRFPQLHIPPGFLFIVRHFGTGVLVATAFAHLLPTAFLALTDPCLPSFWNAKYPAMAGVIALAAVFVVAIIEMVFSPERSCMAKYDGSASVPLPEKSISAFRRQDHNAGSLYGRSGAGRANSIGQQLSRMNTQTDDISRMDDIPESSISPRQAEGQQQKLPDVELGQFRPEPGPEQKRRKQLLQCILLEVGILFHSVFIGMALAVAVGNDFVVLLIAIAFHQTFEGLALGSRIATIGWSTKLWQPWLMALAYGCTTPLGQVIGIATHTLYSPDSMVGLLMVGIMNAISSGLLIFTSLIDLLNEDFLSDESWKAMRGRRRYVACGLVFLGAFGMSLIGAWA